MKYTFQHYLDIQTSASSVTMVRVAAGGEYAMERTKHLWGAYKYVKLGRVSIKLLPASTLPVDPLGLSYDDSDPQTVDPRDQMNPGLVRITNGEDIFTSISDLSDEQQEQMYINTMLDPRWSKFMLQSGFKRSATPLYWNVGQLLQDPYPGSVINVPGIDTGGTFGHTSSFQLFDGSPISADGTGNVVASANRAWSDGRGLFQTGHRGRMSWMPTDAFQGRSYRDSDGVVQSAEYPLTQPLPEINVITCLFPKAHKTIYYYRMFITETVYFSGLKNSGINGSDGLEYRAFDNFMFVQLPRARAPSQGISFGNDAIVPPNTGGNEHGDS